MFHTNEEYKTTLKVLNSLIIYARSTPEIRAHNCKVDDVIGLVSDEIDDKNANESRIKIGDQVEFWFWADMRKGEVSKIKDDIATLKFDKDRFAGWTIMDIGVEKLTKLIP